MHNLFLVYFVNLSYMFRAYLGQSSGGTTVCIQQLVLTRGADKSLARTTSRYILFDGENISFDASLVIYINSTNVPPIVIINRIYETQNLLSLQLVSFLVGLRTLSAPLYYSFQMTVCCPGWIGMDGPRYVRNMYRLTKYTKNNYVEIKCQLDATDYIYCRFYCMLNMFRAILLSSSLQTGHITFSSAPYRQPENQSTIYHRQRPSV